MWYRANLSAIESASSDEGRPPSSLTHHTKLSFTIFRVHFEYLPETKQFGASDHRGTGDPLAGVSRFSAMRMATAVTRPTMVASPG